MQQIDRANSAAGSGGGIDAALECVWKRFPSCRTSTVMQEAPPWGQSYSGPITAAGLDRKMKLTGCVDAAKCTHQFLGW